MKKGFTLIELLIVIGILAILATVALLVINPAELLRQARDSQRISDLGSINSAIGLYLATVSTPSLGTALTCYASAAGADCRPNFVTDTASATPANYSAVDGTGWVRVNFNQVSGGSPLAALPLDPINNATYFYAYMSTSTKYEMNANLESERYASGGADNREGTDGGDSATLYEAGNRLDL